MKLRHAAALALVGWYLMVPPIRSYVPLILLPNEPLTKWEQRQSYDTAEQCKAARKRIQKYLARELTKQRLGKDSHYIEQPVAQEIIAEQGKLNLSRCIATDDPRLKSN
jgi:hypothetical protein